MVDYNLRFNLQNMAEDHYIPVASAAYNATSAYSINNNIKLVRTYLLKVKNSLNYCGQLYIPNMDCYFSYEIPQKKKIFAGSSASVHCAWYFCPCFCSSLAS